MSNKILVVIGTRPEAIKMAPVIHELQRATEDVETLVVVTGQHRDMLDNVLDTFGIVPDYDLNVMVEDQSLVSVTSKVLSGMDAILEKETPAFVLVQGDTTTAFAAGLAGFYRKVMIGHVEAGLRTGEKYYPFPEEINRKLLTHLGDVHFAPTGKAKENLLREGIDTSRIRVTGNTVIDALFLILKKQTQPDLGINFEGKKVVLLTAHRRENFGRPLQDICAAVRRLRKGHPDVEFLYPVHPNPNVRGVVQEELGTVEGVHLVEPMDYASFAHAMDRSYLILTDSGGVQEEAPSIGKPVLVLRNETERPEGVEAGTVRVVGSDVERIVSEVEKLLVSREEYERMATAVNPYGDGLASQRIREALVEEVSR